MTDEEQAAERPDIRTHIRASDGQSRYVRMTRKEALLLYKRLDIYLFPDEKARAA